MTTSKDGDFAARVIAWQRVHGRHDLPWQQTRDPYRIWLSEVMLQQTQVATVIPYFLRFLERFPDVASLGAAELDEVLALWSGLGYYSRGRNLHAAAVRVAGELGGRFPTDRATLESLPGVGRSTAAAIAAFSGGAAEAILDGNVKRVLARHFAIEGHPAVSSVEKRLWTLAESLLPRSEVGAYTQGLMDLGATLCTRSRPRCGACPLADTCEAHRQGRETAFPSPRPKKVLPHRTTVMLVLTHEEKILLARRPPSGIWGGLWSLPEFPTAAQARAYATSRAGRIVREFELLPVEHGFSHYRLTILPLQCVAGDIAAGMEEPGWRWMRLEEALAASLPAPVRLIATRVDLEPAPSASPGPSARAR